MAGFYDVYRMAMGWWSKASNARFQEPFTTLYASRSTVDLPATNSAASLFTTDCTALLNSCDQPTILSGPQNDN